jgi:hypothetical protein
MRNIDTRSVVVVPIQGEDTAFRVRRFKTPERYVYWARVHTAQAQDAQRDPSDSTIGAFDDILIELAVDRLESVDVTIDGVALPPLTDVASRREWVMCLPSEYLIAVHFIATGTPLRPKPADAPVGNS